MHGGVLRTLTAAAKAAFYQLNFPMIILVQLDFLDGTVYLSNANYTFTWNGHDWVGIGTLGSIEAISEGSALQMYGCALTLSGVPTELISEALSTNYQGRSATIWLAPLTADYAFIADPVVVFKGRMDTMDIEVGTTSTITLSVESRLVDWERPRIRRFNDEDQRAEYPTDRGFRYVDQMVQKDLKWGRA
jgi:hypothetical protein